MSQAARKSAAEHAAQHGVHPVTPHLTCAGAADAIEFYKKAFGAEEMVRVPGPDDRLMHACIRINGSSIMLVDAFPERNGRGPDALGGTPVHIHLTVDDADAWAERADRAGATVTMPVAEQFWGDRYGMVTDPFGHVWSLATPVRTVTESELREGAAAAIAAQEGQGCGAGADPKQGGENRELVLSLTLDAPRDKVWRCWTEAELLTQWFAPSPWTAPSAEADVRPGGVFRVAMRSPEGKEMDNPGVYLDVVPGEKLVFTDAYSSAWEPSARPFMTVALTFEDAGSGRTNYTARVRHWTPADRIRHEKMGFREGWTACARQLEEVARKLD